MRRRECRNCIHTAESKQNSDLLITEHDLGRGRCPANGVITRRSFWLERAITSGFGPHAVVQPPR